mmetsp:Transcript_904/g.3588  ORF Transcript_904/g.3588 Transcript_904/m.3588 type:complete len:327 (-) Transcript_904:863-1843(-)
MTQASRGSKKKKETHEGRGAYPISRSRKSIRLERPQRSDGEGGGVAVGAQLNSKVLAGSEIAFRMCVEVAHAVRFDTRRRLRERGGISLERGDAAPPASGDRVVVVRRSSSRVVVSRAGQNPTHNKRDLVVAGSVWAACAPRQARGRREAARVARDGAVFGGVEVDRHDGHRRAESRARVGRVDPHTIVERLGPDLRARVDRGTIRREDARVQQRRDRECEQSEAQRAAPQDDGERDGDAGDAAEPAAPILHHVRRHGPRRAPPVVAGREGGAGLGDDDALERERVLVDRDDLGVGVRLDVPIGERDGRAEQQRRRRDGPERELGA